jgi:molybdenum cofactor biosynthesis enzyme MoaA
MEPAKQSAVWTIARSDNTAPHVSTGLAYAPEASPFTTLLVDLTHRCNMVCRNCYIPNRDIPDLDTEWLYGILRRLPRRTRIRLVGAEPTVRRDLPEIIRTVRRLRHLPVLMTNGLKLRKAAYVRELRAAGMRTVHLSMNGGIDDDLYLAIDEMRCAGAKRAALDNLCDAGVYVTVGMILVPGVNVAHVRDFWRHLAARPHAREIHFRSVGEMGTLHGSPGAAPGRDDRDRARRPRHHRRRHPRRVPGHEQLRLPLRRAQVRDHAMARPRQPVARPPHAGRDSSSRASST